MTPEQAKALLGHRILIRDECHNEDEIYESTLMEISPSKELIRLRSIVDVGAMAGSWEYCKAITLVEDLGKERSPAPRRRRWIRVLRFFIEAADRSLNILD